MTAAARSPRPGAALGALVATLACLLAGCGDAPGGKDRNNTAVLGGYGPQAARPDAVLSDAQGNAIPSPPAPAGTPFHAVRTQDEEAVAVWVTDQHVVAARWQRATGWTTAEPLERIYGESSNPRIASNGLGPAMVVWHHRVGNIHSLRFSRFDGAAWSAPDVLPGALPRPGGAAQDAPQLEMDAQGRVTARWTSGFHAAETQVARFDGGRWSDAASEAVASAPSASPASPSPSPAQSPAPARPATGP